MSDDPRDPDDPGDLDEEEPEWLRDPVPEPPPPPELADLAELHAIAARMERERLERQRQRAAELAPKSRGTPSAGGLQRLRFDEAGTLEKLFAAKAVGDAKRAHEQAELDATLEPRRKARREHLAGKLPDYLNRIGAPAELRRRPDGKGGSIGKHISQQHIPASVIEWARTFPYPAGHAVLAGTVGSGKSTCAVWLLRQFYLKSIGQDPSDEWEEPRCMWVSCTALYDAFFDRRRDFLARVAACKLLVIDDLGVSYETAWPLSRIDDLLNTRHEANRPCIVTTNLLPTPKHAHESGKLATDSLEGRYPRVFSRLTDASGPGLVRMTGPDLRRPHTPKLV